MWKWHMTHRILRSLRGNKDIWIYAGIKTYGYEKKKNPSASVPQGFFFSMLRRAGKIGVAESP
jgi:hypothetical protein